MKSSFDGVIWRDDHGTFVGLSLGADFTAEHEWGIKGLRRFLGIDTSRMGVEKRATHIPEKSRDYLKRVRGEKYEALIFRQIFSYEKDREYPEGKELDTLVENYKFIGGQLIPKYKHYPKKGLDPEWDFSGAWDENSFGILVPKKNFSILDALQKSLLNDDALVYLGGSENPFSNSGLCIVVRSRLPEGLCNQMEEKDREHQSLLKDAEKTGIEKTLEKAGKRWFSLSPKRPFVDNGDGTYRPFISSTREETNTITKHNVVFWLNPMEQSIHNSGWFTVEQLEEWAKDSGPVMMKKEECRR